MRIVIAKNDEACHRDRYMSRNATTDFYILHIGQVYRPSVDLNEKAVSIQFREQLIK